jgi:hypothetical protein
MNPKELAISFTDSPEEEVALIKREFNLSDVAKELEGAIMEGDVMSEDSHIQLAQLLTTFQEMFSLELPALGDTTEDTLRLSSRDINLSRLLRERGLVRLYRLIRERDEDNVPLFLGYLDPYGGTPFKTQEDFIGWIAKDAHIPRSTLFMRFATYDKMLGVGFELEPAFQTVITKPYAMREVLNLVATWDRGGRITDVNPQIARSLASRILSEEEAAPLIEAADYYEENPSPVALKELIVLFRPAIKTFIEELAHHTNTKEMMDYVRYDILAKPEISYSWKDEALILHIVRKAIADDGTEVVINVEDIPFVPDYPGEIDEEIVDDLLDRLPIKNRRDVLAERERRQLADQTQGTLPF